MKYLILTYESKEDFEARCGNEARQEQYWSAWKAYIDSMSHAGIIDSMHAVREIWKREELGTRILAEIIPCLFSASLPVLWLLSPDECGR